MTIRSSNPIDAYIGSRVRLRRVTLAMTLSNVATAAQITRVQISRYERGMERIGSENLFLLATALKVPPAFFFDGLAGFLGLERPVAPAAAEPSHLTLVHEATSPQESLELIRAFAKIGHPELRRRVFDLIKAAGQ